MIAPESPVDCWLRERSRESRDRVITHFRYLCIRGRRKFLRGGLDRADLEQVAALGLLKACDRYDAAQKTPFEAYAWLFVVGELMHYVRDHERLVRPPRRLWGLEGRLARCREMLTLTLGREPLRHEIARVLQVDDDTLRDLEMCRRQIAPRHIESLNSTEVRRHACEDRAPEDRVLMKAALAHLTRVERAIVLGVYAAGYTQTEIGRRLGYSRRHISRLHRVALEKMRPFWLAPAASGY